MKNIYLERYATKKHYFPDYQVDKNTNLIVVIPAHDEPFLTDAIKALYQCHTDFSVEIIVVINASESAENRILIQNQLSFDECITWTKSVKKQNFNIHFIIVNEMPKKHAGVGLARKIGMDEAVRMFESIGNSDGIILCFDADCTCTDNLFFEVQNHFTKNPKSPACSIHFEHPLEGSETPMVYQGIINYELHLRYYIDALKFTDFPYSHQTIGSSMQGNRF